MRGYTGQNCEVDIDYCQSNDACRNGATCLDGVQGYTCNCTQGWYGEHCAVNPDDCGGHACANGASCVDGLGGYSCSCAAGWTGERCATQISGGCAANPCQHGTVCADDSGSSAGYTCDCGSSGYAGANCDQEVNECAGFPKCANGGTCIDLLNGFNCSCASGYTGATCEEDIDYCAGHTTCQNGATCVDGVSSFSCGCTNGWRGETCAASVDDCASAPCGSHGTCVDGHNSYSCTCRDEWTGVHCDVPPAPVNCIGGFRACDASCEREKRVEDKAMQNSTHC